MVKIKQLVLLIGLLGTTSLVAQSHRYMVFFSDKDSVDFDIESPEAFLSDRAIARRTKMGIEITEEDLPVDDSYVQQVKGQGASVFFTTRWFNGVLTEMNDETATAVGNLDFVDSVVYVAKDTKLSSSPGTYTVASEFLELTAVNATTTTQNALIGVDAMHEDGYRGEGILIAVFDDGFKGVNQFQPFEHIFTGERLLATKDFVKNSGNVFQYDDHGSSVLSCIGQNYGDGYTGTAPNADFILCVTEDNSTEYRIEEYNWLFAAEFADSAGVDVINGSLGYFSFSDSDMDYEYSDMDGKTTVVSRAAQMASDRGIVVVVSAGNEGNGSWKYITTPADAEGALAVGSVTSQGTLSGFSSIGPAADGRIKPDVVAMGSYATIFYMSGNNGYISTGNGTSFSSPQVAGLAAGLLQAYPDWTAEELISNMKETASLSSNPDNERGYGIPTYLLNNVEAIGEAGELRVYPNPFHENVITIDLGELKVDNRLEIKVLNLNGQEVYSQKVNSNDVSERMEITLDNFRSGTYFLTLRSKKLNKTVKIVKI